MYDYIIAVVLGIVEGATEFLPVSSTGHMILVGHLLGYDGRQAGVFEVFIQLGAIMAVAVIYKEKILTMLHFNGWRPLLRRESWRRSDTGLTLVHIAAGAVPVLPVGYLLHHFIKTYLFSVETVLIGLVAGGVFMVLAEKSHRKTRCDDVDKLTVAQSFGIGLFQILALWPGFSRSGSTIVGGLFLGIGRKAAADFSFIMAVPVMLAACFYDLLKNMYVLTDNDFDMITIGFFVAFAVSYASVYWFLNFLNRSTLTTFAVYRFIIAALAAVYFFG